MTFTCGKVSSTTIFIKPLMSLPCTYASVLGLINHVDIEISFWPETLRNVNSFLFRPLCLYIAEQKWQSMSVSCTSLHLFHQPESCVTERMGQNWNPEMACMFISCCCSMSYAVTLNFVTQKSVLTPLYITLFIAQHRLCKHNHTEY